MRCYASALNRTVLRQSRGRSSGVSALRSRPFQIRCGHAWPAGEAGGAQVKIGDHIAVFGMGALGLIAVQLARAAGDAIEARLALTALVQALDGTGERQ